MEGVVDECLLIEWSGRPAVSHRRGQEAVAGIPIEVISTEGRVAHWVLKNRVVVPNIDDGGNVVCLAYEGVVTHLSVAELHDERRTPVLPGVVTDAVHESGPTKQCERTEVIYWIDNSHIVVGDDVAVAARVNVAVQDHVADDLIAVAIANL